MHKPRSQQLFDHAIKFVTPFSTTLGHAWAIVPAGPTRHNGWPLFSRHFRSWLASTFHHEHGLFPGCHAIDSALTLLAAHARYSEFPAGEIATRIGWHGDPRRPESLLIHLANANDELIEITPDAHRIVTVEDLNRRRAQTPRLSAAPLNFIVEPATAALPQPVSTTAPLLDQLGDVLGLSGPALARAAVWLFAALRPTGPYPVLVLTGPRTAGKSTLARAIRALIDPSGTPLLAAPSNEHDLFAAALHNHVLAFDHVDKFHPYVAGAIARLATGTGVAIYRRNIFDDPESLALARPIVVTAPEVPVAFANNSMRVHLDGVRLRHRSEFDLQRALASAAPSILGSLCAAVSCALRNIASTESASPSHFADVHHWTLAASSALAKMGYPRMASTPRALSEQLNVTPLKIFGIDMQKRRDADQRWIHLTQTPESCVTNALT